MIEKNTLAPALVLVACIVAAVIIVFATWSNPS